jgi:hypothetical protein
MSTLKYPEPDLDGFDLKVADPEIAEPPPPPKRWRRLLGLSLAIAGGVLLGALLAVGLLRPGTGPLAADTALPPPEVAGFAESYVHTFIASRAPGNEQVLAPYTPAEVEWAGGALGDRHVVDTTTVGLEPYGEDEWRVEVAAHVMDFDRERDGYRRPVMEHYEVVVTMAEGTPTSLYLPARMPKSQQPAPGLAPVLEKAESGEIAAAAKEYLDAHYAAIGGYTGFTMIGIAVEPAGEERSRVIVRARAKPVEGASAVHDHVLEAVSGEDGWVVAHPTP